MRDAPEQRSLKESPAQLVLLESSDKAFGHTVPYTGLKTWDVGPKSECTGNKSEATANESNVIYTAKYKFRECISLRNPRRKLHIGSCSPWCP